MKCRESEGAVPLWMWITLCSYGALLALPSKGTRQFYSFSPSLSWMTIAFWCWSFVGHCAVRSREELRQLCPLPLTQLNCCDCGVWWHSLSGVLFWVAPLLVVWMLPASVVFRFWAHTGTEALQWERRKGEVFLECTIAGPYVTMAVTVCFESVLRNQHKFCSRRPPVSVASRHLGVSSLSGSRYGFEIRLQSLPVRRLQQRGRFCVRCSSTADASRDSCTPLPTLYELLEVPQHVGEYFMT